VTSRLAVATEGAPENKPAKVFGLRASLSIANATTKVPPSKARTTRSAMSFIGRA
jgi:hypothetical protein